MRVSTSRHVDRRPLIAKRLVEIAAEHGADAISHGATGKGNDRSGSSWRTHCRPTSRSLRRGVSGSSVAVSR